MCAVAVAIAGVLYEVAAPRADETTLDGAAAWASADWSVAHISAIVALILIPLGYNAIRASSTAQRWRGPAFAAATIGHIGSGPTISYYRG
ncbi:hypothetical protein ACFVJS_22435 [Nocardioides sp. NPDC057772]|uniref:hypothetical protein n=1 Tax=Nocardioides sp. NPDC057772 TaxID=3346245 RepID=UPI003670A91E